MSGERGLNFPVRSVSPDFAENDDRWSLVLRVAASPPFSKAAQLREILLYISRQAITEPETIIKEYEIGCNVLGRRPDFNPHDDNIVRVQVSHLRKKLNEYFSTFGKDEPLYITLPKGTYVPCFGPKVLETVAADGEGRAPHREEGRFPIPFSYVWMMTGLLLIGMVIGAGIAVVVSTRQGTSRPRPDPVVAEAWSAFARTDSNVLLSTATPLTLQMEPEGHQVYGSPTYPAPPEAYVWFRQHRPLAPGAKLGMAFTDNLLGVGTMSAVVTTVNTLRSFGSSYQILPEREATLAALRGRNAILFGTPFQSQAVSRLMEKTPLTLDYERSVGEFVIRDRISGLVLVPQRDANGEFSESYGLITVLDTRDSDRGRLGTVIFSGIASAATHGAAEFFASPRSLHNLRALFAREGVKGFPAAYQVVVKCTFGNLVLLSYEYRLHRILQKN